jgi:hypothetical protein
VEVKFTHSGQWDEIYVRLRLSLRGLALQRREHRMSTINAMRPVRGPVTSVDGFREDRAWAVTGAIVLLASSLPLLQAASSLVPSSDGITVYDTVNNVTWLADFNLPASNRFGIPVCAQTNVGVHVCINPSGSMNYGAAAAWVAAMNAANYLGHSNWQLPTTPLLDSSCGKTGPNGQSFGFGCTAGALDTIYNNVGLKPPNTAVPIPPGKTGPFSNVQPYLYWSQSVSSAGTTSGNATFSFATGLAGSQYAA